MFKSHECLKKHSLKIRGYRDCFSFSARQLGTSKLAFTHQPVTFENVLTQHEDPVKVITILVVTSQSLADFTDEYLLISL